jgi:replicative DNA helicase
MNGESYLPPDPSLAALKVPPHSIEAEQAVLGGLMLDNDAWERVADQLVSEDFYRRDHRTLFDAIRHLAEESQPLDVITLTGWLGKRNLLDEVGGIAYLGALVSNTPSASNIKSYAAIVRERAITRQLIRVANEIADSGFHPEGRRVEELLETAEQRVFEISDRSARHRAGFVAMSSLLVKAVDRIDTLFTQGNEITGLASGFIDFDRMTSGLQRSDLIIVAGRPSMGKTTFAMNMVENVAIKLREPVAVFSMEMPGEQLAMRMIASLGKINQQKLRSGNLEDSDWHRLTSAVAILNESPIFIDDTAALTATEMRARARRLKREHGLGMIVLDYLQLMQGSADARRENRATEISEISRGLKAMAKELNVPVIALSQLNRSLEQRQDKRPVMSDLRESGAIEQDADVIVFIYREEVYNKETPNKGIAEIIIGKQRNGPVGDVRLTFRGEFTRFENHASTPADGHY